MIDPREVLRDRFGFDEFRSGQRDVVERLLAGKSAAAVFPTGGGKSLCYQLPALCLPGLTLVVSPLIALMKDQIDALAARGIDARRIDSSLGPDDYRAAMDAVRSGEVRLLYVAPERFQNERFRATMQRLRISLFAVDEAHCISEWGHAFRPDYLKLARFAHDYACERVLALTATATPRVLDDICREFRIDSADAIRTGFYRPNLELWTTPVSATERREALVRRLRERAPGPTIVYVTLQRTAERVADRLIDLGLPARAYHAGMKDDDRSQVQDWFMQSDRSIVVATIAFGMGIDKADIRYVYHYNLPKSLEGYAQEIGRAGRDGDPSICETLACTDDLNVLENFVHGDTPDRDAVLGVVDEVLELEGESSVAIRDLGARHDVRDLVVRTLLTYLELDGWLEGGTPLYSSYRFKPVRSSAEILEEFDGERRDFVRRVLGCAEKARVWFNLDLEAAITKLDEPRERIVRALDYLGEQGWLQLESSGVRHRFRRLKRPEDVGAVAGELYERCLDRERREIERLEQVVDFLGARECQTAALCAHFGEEREPCGHCRVCRDGPVELAAREVPEIEDRLWRGALAVRSSSEALASPRAFARFLCGVTSPRLVKERLTRHDLFGCLQRVPFAELLARSG